MIFFINTKVFVHLTHLKLSYKGLQYLKIIVCLFHFIKSDKNIILMSYLLIFPREVYLTICRNESNSNFFHTWPLHNLIVFTFKVAIQVVDIQLKSTYTMNKTIKFTRHTLSNLITTSVIGNIMFQLFPTLQSSSTHSFMMLFDLGWKENFF